MLTRTNDRKTANMANKAGDKSVIKNAFSLPAGKAFSCPGATGFCEKICYAGRLERIYPSFKTVTMRNWDILKDMSSEDMWWELTNMIHEFEQECDRRGAEKRFRIHADGDFFNMAYVEAWALVVKAHPTVQFWAYTHVPFAAEYLHAQNLPNLGLYFSADPDNIEIAKKMEALGINIAMVARSFEEAKENFKGIPCPEQNKKLPMISDKGGACHVCGLCPFGRKNVLFKVH